MLVNTFYFAHSECCGISIFNRHLRRSLAYFGVNTLDTNLSSGKPILRTPVEILHYTPGAYANKKSSQVLIELLIGLNRSQKLFVIVHGMHDQRESRFQDGNSFPQREEHIYLMFRMAECMVPLSIAATRVCQKWRCLAGRRTRIFELDHPGLFDMTAVTKRAKTGYALLAGISRTKKAHTSTSITKLRTGCFGRGLDLWEHWTNLPASVGGQTRTTGLVSDRNWASLLMNAKVVLCPYETKVQAVSGLMSEAISASRFVITTTFDGALEMQEKYPQLVFLEDQVARWPEMIVRLPYRSAKMNDLVPTWMSFAKSLSSNLLSGAESLQVPNIGGVLNEQVPVFC